MLIKNAVLTAVLAYLVAQFWSRGFGVSVIRTGHIKTVNVRSRAEVIIVFTIAATWSCTKSFWFLRPMDRLLSFRSVKRLRHTNEPRSLTVVIGVSSPYCLGPLSVDKRGLTSIFRTTI